MNDLPEPLVAANVDLRGYEFMPLYGHHLFGSTFNSKTSDAGWRAAVTLWWKAWNQVPAASLPSDDIALTLLAELGRNLRAFKKIKSEALHGFVQCNDGRLYHRALSVWALEAWARRVKERARKAAWRNRMERGQDGDKTGTETGQRRSVPTGQRRDVPAEGKGSEAKRTIKTKTTRATPSAFALPAWLSETAWNDFLMFRKAKRAPMTERAKELAIALLDRLKSEGNDPIAVLNQSIMNGWTSLRPVKTETKQQGSPGWWTSEAATLAKGKELGMTPRPGEALHDFRGRINAKEGQ